MLIAQISDTHIKPEGSLAYGRVDTSAFLARAFDHILHLDPRPDVVLGTGDLVDGGLLVEYAPAPSAVAVADARLSDSRQPRRP